MADEQLFKGLGEIYARLLDHRPILQGEINYFVSEFEKRRGGREEGRLQKSLEYSREISEKLTNQSKIVLDENLPKLTANVATASEMCNMLLEREGEAAKEGSFSEKKAARIKEWSNFMDHMCEQSEAVDREHDDEIRRVSNYYRDLENKLKITD